MTEADRIALLAFLVVLTCGSLVFAALKLFRKSDRELAIERLRLLSGLVQEAPDSRTIAETARSRREARRRRMRESLGFFGVYLARMEALGGPHGLRMLQIGVPAMFLVMLAVNWLLLDLPLWMEAALAVLSTVLVGVAIHRGMVARFQHGFLNQLPDVLDTITRASQAGIPVVQSIRTIGDIYKWPAGPEFRRIGISLQLGNDLSTVLDEAELRIRLPDFSFLCVCLMLQRETGGPLSAALSNLSTLIRERRDLRLKARTLTAEGRLTAKIIGSIPLAMLGFMWMSNPDYIGVLFHTEAGRSILAIAAGMLVIGLFLVNRLAQLKT